MKSWISILWSVLLLNLFFTGCSGNGSGGAPVLPDIGNNTGVSGSDTVVSQTHLWGYYEVEIEIASQAVNVVPNRNTMFTANVTSFINSNPANLSFDIIKTPVHADYVDVDIDVSITHPFATLPQYKGYDVRGVFIGDGSEKLYYDSSLKYAEQGTDQYMMDDPDPNEPGDLPGGAPDGYTRWFNPSEFASPGILGYVPGNIASKGYEGSATLNPYKYFADGLGASDDLWDFLVSTGDDGVFSNGMTNTRNYYIRFPKTKGIRFNYAVIADWAGEDPVLHPSNAAEPVCVSVSVTDNVYYAGPTFNGGYLLCDISIFDWDTMVNLSGYMEDYILKVESTVLYDVHEFSPTEMVPTGGTGNYSTYHVEIEADNVDGTEDNEFWLILECPGRDYSNPFDVPNDAMDDTLAAFFRFDLNVSEIPPNYPPVITGIEDDIIGGGSYKDPVDFYDNNVTYTVLFTDEDIDDTHTISWHITQEGEIWAPVNEVTMPVDWSTYEPGNYEIHVFIDDGTFNVHGGPYPISMNTTPVINSGVDGEVSPLIVMTETYTVDAVDPDLGQTLTYSWTVSDLSTGNPVSGYDGVPGNGDGTLDVDWQAIGSAHEDEYEIDCVVSDGIDDVAADTLAVTTTVNLFYANFVNGEEGMVVNYAQYPPTGQWTYDSAYDVWKESAYAYTSTMFYRYTRSRLRTPLFSVPAGTFNVKLALRQWSNTNDGGDYCYIQYSTNGGSNWSNITYWSNYTVGGSTYSNVNTYNLPSTIKNKTAAAIGFYFRSDYDYNYIAEGWNLREVRVYIQP